MFVDETAANEITAKRRFGWSRKGTPATTISTLTKSKKWSILPLYTYDGFVDWKIVHGSYNSDLFIEFLEDHVIPHTNPFPGPRSVLVMDNARIHHDEVHIFVAKRINISELKGYVQKMVSFQPTSLLILPI
jgi:hypothetical protein